jgi:hypothetical protein
MSLAAGRFAPRVAVPLLVALMLGEIYFFALNHDEAGPAGVVVHVLLGLVLLGFVSLGLLVMYRRPRNPIGWIIAGSGVAAATSGFTESYAIYALFTAPGSLPGGEAMAWLSSWIIVPVLFAAPAMLFLLFPDGTLLSRRWRPAFWLVILTTGSTIAGAFLNPVMNDAPFEDVANPLSIDAPRALYEALGNIGWPGMAVSFLVAALAMIVRLRRSRGMERQQLKWLAAAAAILPLASAAGVVSFYLGYDAVGGFLAIFSIIPIFLAAGYAVLKYRLYDIDVIINRTLVYGSLTLMLALVYFGGVATIQTLFRALTGQEQQPQVAVVVSTLAIAALFNPLRRRMQSLIDRRFYRGKYDAQTTLSAFSNKLREETDLDRLGDELLSAVRETMQPAHASLWLRPAQDPDRNRSGIVGGVAR